MQRCSSRSLPQRSRRKSRGRIWSDLQSVYVSVSYHTMRFQHALWSLSCCGVTRVVLVYCDAHLENFRDVPHRPHGSLYFFSPTQINFLHLIKDVSCRLSGFCLLSPAFSPFALPPLSLLSFPPHVFLLMSKLIASHLLYRILESFCIV